MEIAESDILEVEIHTMYICICYIINIVCPDCHKKSCDNIFLNHSATLDMNDYQTTGTL